MLTFLLAVLLLVQGETRSPWCAFDGRGYTDIGVTSPNGGRQLDALSCQKECRLSTRCNYWTFYNHSHMCWLMGERATLMDQPDPKATSGAKLCTSGVKPGEAIILTDATPEEVAAKISDSLPVKGAPEALDTALEAIHSSAEKAYAKITAEGPRNLGPPDSHLRGKKRDGCPRCQHRPKSKEDMELENQVNIAFGLFFLFLALVSLILTLMLPDEPEPLMPVDAAAASPLKDLEQGEESDSDSDGSPSYLPSVRLAVAGPSIRGLLPVEKPIAGQGH